MKSHPLVNLLLVALFVNAAASVLFSYQYVRSMRKAQQFQIQRNQISYEMSAFEALLNETWEYGKRNPKIDPVLQSIGLKAKAAAPTNAPQTRAK